MKSPMRCSVTLLMFSSCVLLAEASLHRSAKTQGDPLTVRWNAPVSSSHNENEDNWDDGRDGRLWSSRAGSKEEGQRSHAQTVYAGRDRWVAESETRMRRSAESGGFREGDNRRADLKTGTANVAHKNERDSLSTSARNASAGTFNKDTILVQERDTSTQPDTGNTARAHLTMDVVDDRKDEEDDRKMATKLETMVDKNEKRVRYKLDDLYQKLIKQWLLQLSARTASQSTVGLTKPSDSTNDTALHNSTSSVGALDNSTSSVGAISTDATTISTPTVSPTQLRSNGSDTGESYLYSTDTPHLFSPNSETENNSTLLIQPPQTSPLNASLPPTTSDKQKQQNKNNVYENIYKNEEDEEYSDPNWSRNTESRQNGSQDVNDTKQALHNVLKLSVFQTSDTETGGNSSKEGKSVITTIENVEEMEEKGKSSETDDPNSSDCPGCAEREKDVKHLRLRLFKNLLIQKLRLDPKDVYRDHKFDAFPEDRVPKLPESMVEQTLRDNAREIERDEFHARDQELIIAGEDMGRDCVKLQATGCYSFNLKSRIKGEVAQADLWIYKMKDANDVNGQTFNLYELERLKSGRLAHSSMIVSAESTVEEGWVVLNVTRSLRKWADKRKGSEMLAVRCVACTTRSHRSLYGTKLDYKPLLVIKYDTYRHISRQKRSQSCDPRSECCKRELVVNFHEIGMSHIIQPRYLSVDYCYGECNDIHQYSNNYTSIKQRHRWSGSLANSHAMRQQLKPCCAPVVLKDIFIMTSDGDGTMVRKLLPKVIVETCGCV